MDYQVFLLTRIREEYDKTRDNTEAVAYGLRTTAGIITGAALIMVAVFTGFAAGRLGPLQQMGFGLAVAVLHGRHDRADDPGAGDACACSATGTGTCRSGCEWLPKLNVEGREPERVQLIPDSQEELVPAVERGHEETPLD